MNDLKWISISLFLLLCNISFGQVSNDDCDTAKELLIGASDMGSTIDALKSSRLFSSCHDDLNQADVFYRIALNPDFDALEIEIKDWTGSGSLGAQIYFDNGNCDLKSLLKPDGSTYEHCGTGDRKYTISTNCLPDTITHLVVKIGSAEDDGQGVNGDEEGNFKISSYGLNASCDIAETCLDVKEDDILSPTTNAHFELDYTCVTSCLDFACPEIDAIGDPCNSTNWPTVWFQIEVDDDAAQIFATVETFGTWDAVWTFYGGEDCGDLQQISTAATPPCSNDDTTPELLQQPVDNTWSTYWLAVTVDPESLPATLELDNPGFHLCVATTINAVVCLGDLESSDCAEPSLIIEAISRNDGADPIDPDGDGEEGPFCPGDKVDIYIEFFYDASETGVDWLIGFVPVFGEGWDMSQFDFNLNAPLGNGMHAEWHEVGGECAPIVQEPQPILCTYTNSDGILQLCNLLCESCPCASTTMQPGDPLPSGYFWVTNGGNAGCENDCSPGEGWGIGTTTVNIIWQFSLFVKEFDSQEEAFLLNDLQLSFQTFSDGVAGCWEDPVGECLLDKKQLSSPWRVSTDNFLNILVDSIEDYCQEAFLDIHVEAEGNSDLILEISAENNPNIIGATNHSFSGDGVINDTLTNVSQQDQIQRYFITYTDTSASCKTFTKVIEIRLLGELDFLPKQVVDRYCNDELINDTLCIDLFQYMDDDIIKSGSWIQLSGMPVEIEGSTIKVDSLLINSFISFQYVYEFDECTFQSEDVFIAFTDCSCSSQFEMNTICELSEVVCDLSELADSCFSFPYNEINMDLFPDDVETMNYSNGIIVPFLAGSGEYNISIQSNNILSEDSDSTGMIGLLYEDCSFSNILLNIQACGENGMSIDSQDLEAGQTYYLYLQPCSQTISNFSIEVTQDFEAYMPETPQICIEYNEDSICDSLAICPFENIELELSQLEATVDYFVEISDASADTIIVQLPNDPMPDINSFIDEPGVYELCIVGNTPSCNDELLTDCIIIRRINKCGNSIHGGVWIEKYEGDGLYIGAPEDNDVSVNVELYSDNDCDGSLSQLISEFKISSSGEQGYVFNNLSDGCYIIVIPEEEFGFGGPLRSTELVEPYIDANIFVDNDNNGFFENQRVRTSSFEMYSDTINYVDFGFRYLCNQPNFLSSETCTEADIVCNLNVFDGFCGRMVDIISGNGPSPLCNGSSEAENISWFSFIAGNGDWRFIIDDFACDGNGIEVGIYDNCNWNNIIFCKSNCQDQEAISVGFELFVPGQTYWMYINGCEGSVCSYEMIVEGDFVEPNILPEDLCVQGVGDLDSDGQCDNVEIDVNTELTFEILDVPEQGTFLWSIIDEFGETQLEETDSNELVFTFGEIGEFSVCIESISNGCPPHSYSGFLCRTVIVKSISSTKDTELEITDLLELNPCEVNIFNITGQEVMSGASCEQVLSSIQSRELISGIYCYQIILDDGRVVYGNFISI